MKLNIKQLYQKCSTFFQNRKKAIVVSFMNAILLTFGTYLMNNCSIFTGENLKLYAGLEYAFPNKNFVNDSILFINIAYDKQIAKKTIDGIKVGNTDVTDREELIRLLRNLKDLPQDSSYRYIFLDVRFEAGDETIYDTELFETIANTPKLVIANHEDIKLASDSLKGKAAYSDYYATITATNFVRFKFLREQGESMPLRAYHELFKDSITRHGLFYFCNKGLCQNTLVINSPIKRIDNNWVTIDSQTDMKRPLYFNLNKVNNKSDLAVLANKKYVVIGNMIDDKHDTYFGKIPGSLIVFSAFWALKNGYHIINPWMEVFFFILFFCISLSLFSQSPIIERIPFVKKSKSKFLHFIISFLSYTSVLLVTKIILYLLFSVVPSIWLPALFFSIQKAYFTYKYMSL